MEIQIKGNKIFAPLKESWVALTQEEKLKQEFIARLINHYDYNLSQLGQDIFIRDRYKADIAIWKNAQEKQRNKTPSIIIAVQCKAEHISIDEDDYLIGYNFASTVKANFFVAANLKETKVFHIIPEPTHRKLDRLKEIPKASLIADEKKINRFISETKTFTRDQFTKLLSKCHNIIRNNDKLSPEAAFDEISKVLFMKIMYERKSKEEMIFSKEKFKSDEKNYEERIRPSLKESGLSHLDKEYMQFLFDETKREFENDEIFERGDQIRIKRTSFEMIVEELEIFNLSDTSDDVKGIAFEEFLGRTFRGELGQFFTPRSIVDFMVDVLDPQEAELICDPCCGSGGFLIKAFDYIRANIEKDIRHKIKSIEANFFNEEFEELDDKNKLKVEQLVNDIKEQINKEFDLQNANGRLYRLSHNCIYGTDANPRMARTAKMNMIMHGDGHGGVHHHDGLLNVNGIFDNRFDVILTNPPFGSRVNRTLKITEADMPSESQAELYKTQYPNEYESVALSQIRNNIGKPILDLFEVGQISGLTEVLFLERCLNLLRPGGRMGIVLPEGVLNNSNLQKVRDLFESKAKIVFITSIPQDVFIASGATVKPSLLFFKKFTSEEREIWLSSEEKARTEIEAKYAELLTSEENKISELETTMEEIRTESKLLKGNKKNHSEILKNKYEKLKEREKEVKEALSTLRKELVFKKQEFRKRMDADIKARLKVLFNYSIPIAEVEKAGITSTGAPCENELVPLAKEFKHLAKANKLWEKKSFEISYTVNGKNQLVKVVNGLSMKI